jgi:hypothetical protein
MDICYCNYDKVETFDNFSDNILIFEKIGDGFLHPDPNTVYHDSMITIDNPMRTIEDNVTVRKGIVFHHETVIFRNCDKNGIFYNLHPQFFPNIKNLYMFTHPCHLHLRRMFPDANIYMETWMINRWRDEYQNQSIIPFDKPQIDELYDSVKKNNYSIYCGEKTNVLHHLVLKKVA